MDFLQTNWFIATFIVLVGLVGAYLGFWWALGVFLIGVVAIGWKDRYKGPLSPNHPEGRIEFLLEKYKKSKEKHTEENEPFHLARVVELMKSPRGSGTIKDAGMSGEYYIQNVFGDKRITLEEVIYHIVTLEFPSKYKPLELDIQEIFDKNRGGDKSPKDELQEYIHEKVKTL